ncbi:hypothetical protein TYRP_019309, partial [Tyrophagus putrescentiae]
MPLDKKKVTQKELKQIAEQSSSSYTGSTINVKNRTRDNERNGRDGVLYYAKTTNMRKAEDRLLKSSEWPDNRQKQSNQKEDKGSGNWGTDSLSRMYQDSSFFGHMSLKNIFITGTLAPREMSA